MFFGFILIDYFPWTVSLPIFPISFISSAISPSVYSVTLLFIFIVSSHILPSIWPSINSLAVHHVCFPFPFICPTICLLINSSSFNLPFPPVSFVNRSFTPNERSFPMLESIFKIPFKKIAVSSHFFPISIWFIIPPIPFINISIFLHIFPESFSPPLNPISFIIVPRWMRKSSLTVGHVVHPHPNINCSVRPRLPACSIPLVVLDLTMVDDSRGEFDYVGIVLALFDGAGGELADIL